MADLSKNPLINPPALPNGAPALDQVKVEHFIPAIKAAVDEAYGEIEAIKKNPAKATFENTIEALEFSGKNMSLVSMVFSNISGANSNDEIRAIEEEFDAVTVKFGNDVSLDPDLFARVKAVYDDRKNLNLTAVQNRLLENCYKGFVRGGALLDDASKQRLREINQKLSELGTKFSQNVLKSTAAYEKVIDNEADLAGLPERVKNDYKAAAEEKGLSGKWLIRLSPPPLDIATHADNRALREEIYRARLDIAYQGQFDNRQNILDLVALRSERAKLLGFDTHADFVLAERMAKDRKTVEDFIATNASVYMPAAKAHKKEVEDYAAKQGLKGDLQPWDFAFYERKLKEEKFSFEVEKLRPYFDLEKVLDGMRVHAEKLFGVEMVEQKAGTYPVYHPDVKVYEVKDKKSGELVAVFYGDYYARPGAKNNGAWATQFRGRRGSEVPLVMNVCNYTKPTKDQPTLLSFDEVTTLFHEFGHGLHAMLGRGPYPSLNGFNVKWDFVELPSQVQENWVRKKEVLDTFARHYKTGEALPAEMIEKMTEMENFGAGFFGLRQCFLGMLDMAWHTTDPAKIKSVEDLEDGVVAKATLFKRVAGPMSCSFGHIFSGGYSAGYYSYKWAEVLDADVFAAFEKKGLYDKDLADKLRTLIYEKGDNEDPAILFERMMGRGPDAGAMFRREGLEPPPPGAGPGADIRPPQ